MNEIKGTRFSSSCLNHPSPKKSCVTHPTQDSNLTNPHNSPIGNIDEQPFKTTTNNEDEEKEFDSMDLSIMNACVVDYLKGLMDLIKSEISKSQLLNLTQTFRSTFLAKTSEIENTSRIESGKAERDSLKYAAYATFAQAGASGALSVSSISSGIRSHYNQQSTTHLENMKSSLLPKESVQATAGCTATPTAQNATPASARSSLVEKRAKEMVDDSWRPSDSKNKTERKNDADLDKEACEQLASKAKKAKEELKTDRELDESNAEKRATGQAIVQGRSPTDRNQSQRDLDDHQTALRNIKTKHEELSKQNDEYRQAHHTFSGMASMLQGTAQAGGSASAQLIQSGHNCEKIEKEAESASAQSAKQSGTSTDTQCREEMQANTKRLEEIIALIQTILKTLSGNAGR